MSRYLNLLFFLLLPGLAAANKIDDLMTDADVNKFISTSLPKADNKTEIPKNFIRSSIDVIAILKKCDVDIDTAAVGSWAKLDINGDHLTDLLVMGFATDFPTPYLITDNGKGAFEVTSVNYSWAIYRSNCEYATVLRQAGRDFLLFHSKLYIDTLTYLAGNLIEYNPKPTKHKIASIRLDTEGCFGSCPIFSITIGKNGEATYDADEYNQEKGHFKTIIQEKKFKELLSVVDYIDFTKLEDNYSVNWTDDRTCILSIKFANGTRKRIKDYGAVGSFGLRQIYALIHKLRASEEWQEID